MTSNGIIWSQLPQMVSMTSNGLNGPKWLQMASNGLKLTMFHLNWIFGPKKGLLAQCAEAKAAGSIRVESREKRLGENIKVTTTINFTSTRVWWLVDQCGGGLNKGPFSAALTSSPHNMTDFPHCQTIHCGLHEVKLRSYRQNWMEEQTSTCTTLSSVCHNTILVDNGEERGLSLFFRP